MKKPVFTFLLLFLALTIQSFAQDEKPMFNLDFEIVENDSLVGWSHFGNSNYNNNRVTTQVKSGNYVGLIEFDEGEPGYLAWGFTIPHSYPGNKITLTGYIKTENVTDGYAGIWVRIDPNLALNNMGNQGVTGTTDWTKYEISLDMKPEETTQIVVGGLLVGKGKMWFDNLSISIDGKDIKDLKPIEIDKEFSKGSQITSIVLDNNQIEHLKQLGLIWGFLKYHHPAIAKGDYNWDYELFRILPAVLQTKSQKELDKLFIDWIHRLGEFPILTRPTVQSPEVKLEPDLGWITNSGFSNELSALLMKVKNAGNPEEHYYIDFVPNVGNPVFKNESGYSSMTYPDAGYRLLALYRYWNIIQYYFPYKHLIEEDWKQVLKEFIPKLNEAEDETAYTLAILKLIERVHDTHANIRGGNPVLRNYFGLNYAPVELTFVEGKPIVTGFYDEQLGEETGLKVGDQITTINKKPVEEIIKGLEKYSPASNYPTKLRDIAGKLLRTNDSEIDIEFIRNGNRVSKTLKSFPSSELTITSKLQSTDTSFRLINKNIAYINLGSLQRKHLPEIWKEIKNTKGLIIEIRNYPSDFLVFDLGSYLMPESTPFVKFTQGSIENPGLFTFSEPLSVGTENEEYYKGKVVILINEVSQSSAEYHTMAYRVHPNATVIGSTTAAADGNVSGFMLPGGISTMITGIGVYYPDGRETQRIGIVPDIEVKPSIQGIIEGRDELMEKAVEVIDEN
jgi:C-terminal processing protease CtpA/Prc